LVYWRLVRVFIQQSYWPVAQASGATTMEF
jgi:hypothetical protein